MKNELVRLSGTPPFTPLVKKKIYFIPMKDLPYNQESPQKTSHNQNLGNYWEEKLGIGFQNQDIEILTKLPQN